MSITEQELDQFMEIWKREVGTEITRDWAAMRAQQLIDLYVMLCQKLPGRGVVQGRRDIRDVTAPEEG